MKVTVIGKGTAGILTTKSLRFNFPDLEIDWIYPESNKFIGVGEALVPGSSKFLKSIGIDNKMILKDFRGSIKAGLKMIGWADKTFNLPFDNSVLLNRYMNKDLYPENFIDFENVSHHFNTFSLQDLYIENINNINRTITSFKDIDSDLIVDCRGFQDSDDFIDPGILKNNIALTTRIPVQNFLNPYSTFFARDFGWCWTIPLQDYISIGYVTNDSFINQASEDLKKHLQENFKTDLKDYNTIRFKTGYKKHQIAKIESHNIFSVGLNGAFIEPLQSSGLRLASHQIQELINYIKNGDTNWNQRFEDMYNRAYQFILNHFILCKKSNEYWDYYKNFNFKDSLFVGSNGNDLFDDKFEQFLYANFQGKPVKYDIDKNIVEGKGALTKLKKFDELLRDYLSK
ncbi:putative tryptophan halogenase [Campylobacter phage vB_CcoM-IBB_35]|uniref:Putative tryptophan halogenase n=1 Tax=Campylobacter virus IBB35 TaxID=1006972 RepID=H6SUC8_9CAUD|nr:tryptophan halogenase [Campylobacter phage vB_CcoM-IBB_35]AEI88194.1 putative tryptophan halogenase [Campylobacter phage vB_CcoM-IBB_35]